MKERRKDTNKGITKNVILKTIRDIVIFDVVVIILAGVFYMTMGITDEPKLFIMFFGVLFFYNILLIYFFGSTYKSIEKGKVKAQIAKDIFRKDDSIVVYPKVFPKKGHFKQRKFFEDDLPKIADYYAYMYEDGVIEVVAKPKDKEMILHIEKITEEGFIDAYDVLETTLTDSPN